MTGASRQARPEAPRATWWDRLWLPFWTLPAVIAAGSLGLGLAMPVLDQQVGEPWPWVFEGGVDGARSVLGTIAGAMISVTGLVFSITMVVLQLASSQYSPRVIGNFLESRVSQVTLGVFTGSFVYALTVLRSVGGPADDAVPQISVTVGYLYVVFAVGMFIAFIHHITTAVQISRVMQQVRAQTVAALHGLGDGRTPGAGWSPRPETPRTELAVPGRCGYVTVLDSTLLVERAAALGVVVELLVAPGDFLADGEPFGRAWGRADLTGDDARDLAETLHLGGARTLHSDIGLGVRQLLDIAERALSPGVNDPTTAVQATNELHVILRELAGRADLPAYLVAEDGQVRATYRPQSYAPLLAATVEELVHYGRDSVRVVPHVRAMLADLVRAARGEHRGVTESALAAVDAFLATEFAPTLTLPVDRERSGNP